MILFPIYEDMERVKDVIRMLQATVSRNTLDIYALYERIADLQRVINTLKEDLNGETLYQRN